jgi:hypothetical protein
LTLIDAYAGAAITLESLNARLLLGEEVNSAQFAQASGAMVRIATRLGLHRLKPPPADIRQYLKSLNAEE